MLGVNYICPLSAVLDYVKKNSGIERQLNSAKSAIFELFELYRNLTKSAGLDNQMSTAKNLKMKKVVVDIIVISEASKTVFSFKTEMKVVN